MKCYFPIKKLSLFSVVLFLQYVHAQTVINVIDYGAVANSGKDATLVFQAALAKAKSSSGPVTLVVPPGVYDFFPEKAHTRPCFTSNSTENNSNANKTMAIDITGINNLTISGEGATMMMRGKMTLLVAEKCKNLTLKGLTFDFKRPTMSEITATEKGADFWVGKVHKDSTYRIEGNHIIWVGEGWEIRHNFAQHFDVETEKTWRGHDPTSGVSSIVDQGGRLLRFNVTGKSLNSVKVGHTYQFRDTKRDQLGMWINRCKDVLFEDVTVRAMHGFGILAQYSENITMRRLVVAPDPQSGRTNASAADVTHFSGCRGVIEISDSVLGWAHDDALNVHGTHLRVVAKPGSDQVRVKFIHHQTRGFQAFFPGDEIEFISRDTLLPLGKAKVREVKVENEREQLLTLDRRVPSDVKLNEDVVENVTWTPAVKLLRCDIKYIPTRGILLTTRKPILIEGNQFHSTQMPAILVADDARSWFESGPIYDLTVRGNLFYECGGHAVIDIHPENRQHKGAVHRNINIDDNTFVMKGNRAFRFKSTEKIAITGNAFWMRNGKLSNAEKLTEKHKSSGFSYKGNTSKSAAVGVESDWKLKHVK